MAKGWNIASKIHVPINSLVTDQLEQRSNIVGSPERTVDQLRFLNSRTGFVKISSSVNVFDGDDNTKDFILASQNVLAGGRFDNETKKYDGGFLPASGKSSYVISEPGKGYRPIPGIIGLNSQFHGTYGTYRRTTIEFQVNSLDQLEIVDKLYFRPGMSILVEWGHTVYVNNQGKVIKNPQTISNFFGPTKGTFKTIEEVNKAIDDKRIESDFNYDGTYGQISNFNWQYNQDGTYTCSVDLQGHGSLIESIKMLHAPNPDVSKKQDEEKYINRVSTFVDILEDINDNPDKPQLNDDLSQLLDSVFSDTIDNADILSVASRKSAEAGIPFEIQQVSIFTNTPDETINNTKQAYLKLGNFLSLINECFCPKSDDNFITKFHLGTEDKNDSPYSTFDAHISSDPSKVFIYTNKSKEGLDNDYHFKNKLNEFGASKDNNLLHIYLNVNFVLETFSNIVESGDPTNQTIFDFVDSLLSQMNDLLGNINEFGIHVKDNQNFIVDRALVPNRDELKNNELKAIGTKSYLRDVTIQSQITNDLATIMAIGATAGESALSDNILNLQKWNEGLEDRVLSEKRFLSKFQQAKNKILDENYAKNYNKAAFNAFYQYVSIVNFKPIINNKAVDIARQTTESAAARKELGIELPTYVDANEPAIFHIDDDAAQIKYVHRKVMRDLLNFSTIKEGENPTGLIPVELSATLDGISGLNIAEIFTLQKGLLPSRYDDKVAFILKDINSIVDQNEWTTKITGLMMIQERVGKPNPDINIDELITELADPKPVLITDYSILPDFYSPTRQVLFSRDEANQANIESGLPADKFGSGAPNASRGTNEFHEGWDIFTTPRMKIYAPMDGTLTYTANFSKGGGVIKIYNSEHKITFYLGYVEPLTIDRIIELPEAKKEEIRSKIESLESTAEDRDEEDFQKLLKGKSKGEQFRLKSDRDLQKKLENLTKGETTGLQSQKFKDNLIKRNRADAYILRESLQPKAVTEIVLDNSKVKGGQLIGYARDITKFGQFKGTIYKGYGSGMTNHIHLALYDGHKTSKDSDNPIYDLQKYPKERWINNW